MHQKISTLLAPHSKRNKILILLTAFFLLLGLLYLIYWLIWGRFEIYTDDAYVGGNLVQLMPQVSGTVIKINTDNTRLVMAGEPLIQLDPADMEIAFQAAKANLAQTVRQVRQYYENLEQAQSDLNLRQADLLKAQLDVNRRIGLVAKQAISKEEQQHVSTTLKTAQSQYDIALHRLTSAQALVQNTNLYSHPLVESAKANLKSAYLNLQRTTIIAPLTGYVAKRFVQVGQQVRMGTPMLAIVPLQDMWIDANYKETQLKNIRINQPVDVVIDAYDDVTFHGKVIGLTPGTGAAFALLPAQNATGNWIKIVQRLPVRIQLNPKELQHQPLQIGLSAKATINAYHTNGLRLANKPANKTFFVTDVYANELEQVNQLIAQILQTNAENISAPTSIKATA